LSPESTSENVCFHWNSNHELEVREGGGYQIHYGLEPSKMIGTIFVKMNSSGNYSKIDHQNSGDKESHILKHCISEESLISNLYIPEGKLEGSEFQNLADPIDLSRMEKRGHLFQSGLTYYFRISAYNKYLNEWDSKDQRSSLSEPVRFSFPKEISNR
jgi:hypothetical protein